MTELSPLEHRVSQAEDGMKLTNFIERRLATPPPLSMLHKWIRSGQVRVNKKRAKPFQRLAQGDMVRIPPFASLRSQETSASQTLSGQAQSGLTSASQDLSNGSAYNTLERNNSGLNDNELSNSGHGELPPLPRQLAELFTLVHHSAHMLIINKPSGLAVQPGSGITDSVVHRLRLAYATSPFIPAPAHRLDKNTSGLLAIGLTHTGLALLSKWFATPEHAHKNYFAWVQGDWNDAETTLEDYLCKSTTGQHNMECVSKNTPHALFAQSHVTKLKTIRHKGAFFSLLRVALITGRTHQIRAQLSSRQAPIVGDVRYGGKAHTPMFLHAYELSLPGLPTLRCLPSWENPFAVSGPKAYSQSF